jgi:uncharacterized membrane protein (UPF0136 family)
MAHLFEIIPLAALGRNTSAVTKNYYLVFGVLTIIGGIMGYVKAKSLASIISGSVCGIVLIGASFMFPARPIIGGVVGLLISVLLAGKFVPDYVHKRAFLPAGLMAFLSVASVVISILALSK